MSAGDVKSAVRAIRESTLKRLFDRKQKRTVNLSGPVKFLFDQRQNLIGDMLVNTVAFRAIKDKYPHWRVHVLAGPDNHEVVRENPCVDRIHRMTDTVSGVAHLRAEHFDVFYFHQNRLRMQDFILLKYTDARINIGRAKSDYRLFDHSLDDPGGTERDRYLAFLKFFAIDGAKYHYELPLRDEELAAARSFLSNCPGQITIVFNPFGNPRGKMFSKTTSCRLISEINLAYPDARVILICPPAQRSKTLEIKKELGFSNVYPAIHIETIRDTAALIRASDSVVTPDTSIVHIACAYDKPQLCVYRDQTELALWRPFSDKAISLLPQPPSRDVNDVDMKAFRQGLTAMRQIIRASGAE